MHDEFNTRPNARVSSEPNAGDVRLVVITHLYHVKLLTAIALIFF